jgi:uncharacterized protein
MTKIDGRTKEEAAKQIDQSLKRLQVDHVDLLQFHEIIRFDYPDRIFAQGGALEAFLDAKRAGKLRFIGFTGHKDPHVHLYMLEVAKNGGGVSGHRHPRHEEHGKRGAAQEQHRQRRRSISITR